MSSANLNTNMKFCPKCGQASFTPAPRFYACGECGFKLFRNVAAAVAAIIEYDGAILASVRAKDPDVGRLDLPGGFVDQQETAEQALKRELEEELNLKEITPVYFGTYPNVYPYRSVTYHTLDIIFAVRLDVLPVISPADDVAAIEWIKKSDLAIRNFAFASMRAALGDYTKTS